MTQTFPIADPIWCAGCGHYGVQGALLAALTALDVPRHETFILAGIGCSGTIQNNIDAYGYHALHGRVLPTATGALLANPELTVIAAGGDGDGYAIGMGHLVHTFKRNPSLLYIVMNNGTYGLTKGQPSPTGDPETFGTSEQALDAVQIGLAIPGSTFIARGFTRWSDQLIDVMTKGLAHARAGKGFAFLEVMSPCVTYNDTYPVWAQTFVNADEDKAYDATNRVSAVTGTLRYMAEGTIPAGVLLDVTNAPLEARLHNGDHAAPALQDVTDRRLRETYDQILASYLV